VENSKLLEGLPEEDNPLIRLEFAKKVDFRHTASEYKEVTENLRAGQIDEVMRETELGLKEKSLKESIEPKGQGG